MDVDISDNNYVNKIDIKNFDSLALHLQNYLVKVNEEDKINNERTNIDFVETQYQYLTRPILLSSYRQLELDSLLERIDSKEQKHWVEEIYSLWVDRVIASEGPIDNINVGSISQLSNSLIILKQFLTNTFNLDSIMVKNMNNIYCIQMETYLNKEKRIG